MFLIKIQVENKSLFYEVHVLKNAQHERASCLEFIFTKILWTMMFPKKKEAYLFSLNFQNLLFTPPPSKTFSRGQGIVGQDLDLYIDCFVSCFRITPHNNDVLKICLNPHSPPIYHFVLVNALHRIITQVRIVSDVYLSKLSS